MARTDWMSPAVIAEDGLIFIKLMHALLGLYCWEWFTSLDFDWQYISGKRAFRWPMIFYFLNRYALLFSFIGITISLDVTTEVNCQALYTFNAIAGNMAIGLASINLSIRTIAVWSKNMYIIIPIVLIILGHWSLLLHGILLKAEWNPAGGGCVITETNTSIIAATFIYSMVFDFIVLCLTAFKLYSTSSGNSRLVTLIFRDGVVYFIIAFLANLVAVVFIQLNLNPVMSIIANVPACVISTTMATRAVRRLANFQSRGAEIYTGSTAQGSHHVSGQSVTLNKKPHVHVQMETFKKEDATLSKSMFDAEAQLDRSENGSMAEVKVNVL